MKKFFLLLMLLLVSCVVGCYVPTGTYDFKQPKENVVEFAIVDVQDYKTFTIIKDLDFSLLDDFYYKIDAISYDSNKVIMPRGEGFFLKYNDGSYLLFTEFSPIEVDANGDFVVAEGVLGADWFRDFFRGYKD